MIGKRQAKVLKATRGTGDHQLIAQEAGMDCNGLYPTVEFCRVFATLYEKELVEVLQEGNGAEVPRIYRLTDKGIDALAEWEAKR